MNKRVSEYLSKRIGEIDEEAILKMGEAPENMEIFNVIRGLEIDAFSIFYRDDNDYDLIYITNRKGLTGFYLKSGINIKYRPRCTAGFCQFLHEKFEKLDEIIVFNTYQKMLRSILERSGIYTFSNQELESSKGKEIVFKTKKGFVVIPFINKKKFYKTIFTGRIYKDNPDENKIYLMFNSDTDRIKIGFSKIVSIRERTLQSKEPGLSLIVSWIAPKTVEIKLHEKFKSKRKRGEYFNLNPRDLREINDIMKIYKRVKVIEKGRKK